MKTLEDNQEMNKLEAWKVHSQEQRFDAIEKKLTKIENSIDILAEIQKKIRKDIDVNYEKMVTIYQKCADIENFITHNIKAPRFSDYVLPLLFAIAALIVVVCK